MTSPISFRFSRSLKTTITPGNQERILQYVRQHLLNGKADNIVVEDKCVSYKGSTSKGRGSLFGSVDSGWFTLVYRDHSWSLSYQINMYKLFITTGIMSIAMGVFAASNGGPWWAGIIAFLWLCGFNWVINLVRHGSVANDIAAGIDELTFAKKTELPEVDKMTGDLKSWF